MSIILELEIRQENLKYFHSEVTVCVPYLCVLYPKHYLPTNTSFEKFINEYTANNVGQDQCASIMKSPQWQTPSEKIQY
jgi:hypothetical protein